MPPRIRLDALDLGYFDTRAIYDHVTECLIWTGATAAGYGYLGIERRNFYAHRLAFYLKWGYWPTEAMHSCDRKRCVAWWHLSDGTKSENMREAVARGLIRHQRGTERPNAKLSEADVRGIRSSGLSIRKAAALYGVAAITVRNIRDGRAWKHVT